MRWEGTTMNNDSTKLTLRNVFWATARHAFVIATGFAALVHSTWTLATIFNGPEPTVIDVHWITWVMAAFLFAFAIDVGQIAISVELRGGERTRAKFIAFATLAGLTYFFQWWYVAMHLPAMPLSSGVRSDWLPLATTMRDAALWIVPAALPLATTIYTFSYAKPKIARPAKSAIASANERAIAAVKPAKSDITIEMPEQTIFVQCPDCDWSKECNSPRSATNSLTAHRRHAHPNAVAINSNGRHHE